MDIYLLSIKTDIFSFILIFSQRWCEMYKQHVFLLVARRERHLPENTLPQVLKVDWVIHSLDYYDAGILQYLRLMIMWKLFLPLSLWTSLNQWHWTFWMQRWRTAIKRRWVLNAIKLMFSSWVTTRPVNSIACLMTICSVWCREGPRNRLSWAVSERSVFVFFRSDGKWLMEGQVTCRSKLFSSRSMRQVDSRSEWFTVTDI